MVGYSSVLFAQGTAITTLRGKISDENGELLIGATVVLTDERSQGTISDLNGDFTLKIQGNGIKSITISYIGYKPITDIIELNPGKVIIKEYTLKAESVTIKEAVITARAVKTSDSYMQKLKAKSSISIDYISAATIRKTGDANVTAAISRVPGVSTSGSFITVRGIGDHYVKTTINGLQIPTLDPFTNNIKLDLFPASLIDNIVISKTLSPDLPSDWAGAYLSIETRDYPENLTISAESSVEYNPQTTFSEVISSERSSTDWMGYDNSLRDRDQHDFIQVDPAPSQYKELVALGMGEYFNSLGIHENTPWNDTYFRLGLVQLGLLAPALIDDPVAVQAAKNAYTNGDYSNIAFNIINARAAQCGQTFPNNWSTIKRSAPLNISQSFSIGNQLNIGKSVFGFIVGFKYGNSIVNDNNAHLNRASAGSNGIIMHINAVSQEFSRETNGWSALVSGSLKINKNNSFSLLFMPNITGMNSVRNGIDSIDAFEKGNRIESQFYEHRQQLVYQFKSEHYVPFFKLKMELNASVAKGKSDAPDFKDLLYTLNSTSNGAILSAHRYYRYLTENLYDYHISGEVPVDKHAGTTRKIKFGAAYQKLDRRFDQYDYSVAFGNGYSASFSEINMDQYFSLDNFGLGTYVYNGREFSTINLYYMRSTLPSNHSIGKRELASGFVMLDYDITSKLRFAGGLRLERFTEYTDAALFDSLKLSRDDERRNFLGEPYLILPSGINTNDIIPSAGIIYKLSESVSNTLTARLNYGKSVLRPSIRESYDGAMYDYELRAQVFGNSSLKSTRVNNYDIRFEAGFTKGDNVSVSLFIKDFRDHIELINLGPGYSWMNVDRSYVKGIEIEGRKGITKNLDIRANVSLIDSRTTFIQYLFEVTNFVKTYTPIDTLSRSMYGQAPYVINAMLTYNNDSIGLTASLNYNIQGPRLVITSGDKLSDVYELPRNMLDLKISQKLNRHFSVSIAIRDILNSPIRRSYNYAGSHKWSIDYDTYRFGTMYKLNFSYRF